MSLDEHRRERKALRFYATAPRDCAYLDGETAVSVFADPKARLSQTIYDQLARYGFRRSGGDLYIPNCAHCSKCIPVRICVQEFCPTRSQARVWKRNRDLSFRLLPAEYRQEHFELYKRYLASRHAGGGMCDPAPDEYMRFVTADWATTRFLELRLGDRPVALAVTDYLDDGLSAVYTCYDPEFDKRSLGTAAILYQIDLARRLGLNWHYLGFWVSGCRKMEYKNRFRPLHAYRNGSWSLMETTG